ncbi:MAG: CvpA family protein [Sedimentisphaerales bacterium]|nr:CvpA family protein [Sedimentisphaerales bacterium]
MIAILIFTVITGVLIFYQVFTQGLFSNIIMAVLSLVAAVTALNYYEPLSVILNDKVGIMNIGWRGVSLLAIFVVTLFALRMTSDQLIKGNMNFPMIIDRAGSGLCALISSLTISGMIALGLQNMPISAVILGFDRCGESLQQQESDKGFFPFGDSFVTAVMGQVSCYCLAGRDSFAHHHPDYLRELYLNRLIPDDFKGSRQEAGSDALAVEEMWPISSVLRDTQNNEEVTLETGESLIGVRIKLKPGQGNRGDMGTVDGDKSIRFSMGQIRLVGFDPDEPDKPGYSRYPIGFHAKGRPAYLKKSLNEGHFYKSSQNQPLSLLFKWPGKLGKAPPQYIEFKQSSRSPTRLKKASDEK